MGKKSADRSKVEKLRRDYTREKLSIHSVNNNPIEQFLIWFEQALSADLLDANAMTLSTAAGSGKPSSRIVLLKGIDEQGFRFYSNYRSRKGEELAENPAASLCFYWAALERQVRIEGEVKRMSRDESESYFRERPRLSQLGAWASEQSSRVSSREELEDRFNRAREKFKNRGVPLPEFWGGYILQPDGMEFWQGRKGRLHDRICYKKRNDPEEWEIFRLSP